MKNHNKKNYQVGLYLLILGAGLFYWFYSQPQKQGTDSNNPPNLEPKLTLQQRIQKKTTDIKLKQSLQQEKVKAEQFKKPVGKIDPLDTGSSSLDRGVHFPENTEMKEVFKDLNTYPFKNDLDQDPEHIARQQAEHQRWIDEYLKEKNEKEKKEFIKKLIKIARQQGYKAYLTKDMKLLLEPIPLEQKSEEPEEIKIIY